MTRKYLLVSANNNPGETNEVSMNGHNNSFTHYPGEVFEVEFMYGEANIRIMETGEYDADAGYVGVEVTVSVDGQDAEEDEDSQPAGTEASETAPAES